ncbi:diguanylate cyclase domain-containing protein [Aquabacterium sp.]|uniref:diguanylate cyclase domain-containing protein n=1 Tax=Aquabacterium sp. TaxID=1872578 RepID=UPI002BB172CE|nr:diguanylate cyclase [Aquabacterium sp.]HSW04335.1 diguanylate cyclase [Aquabacterium sp.]
MQTTAPAAPRVAGLLVGLLGAVMVLHWVFQVDAITGLIPGAELVGIVTPMLFVAAGLCFFNASRPPGAAPWLARLSAMCIAALIAFPVAYLFESATGIALGIDFVRAGTVPTAANPYPGRMSPNASLAFLLSGIAFGLRARRPTRAGQLGFLALVLAVFMIGLSGLVGYFVDLETLYRLASFNRMLPVTAFGITVVGTGLWLLHDASQAFDPKALHKSERRIKRRSLAIITLVALAGGVASFALMRDTFEQSVSKNMLLTATTNATSLAHTIEVSLWFPRTVANRPAARQALDKLSKAPDDAPAKDFLQRVADSFLTADLTGVHIYAASGERVAQAGSMTSAQGTVIQHLANAGQSTLLAWKDGYLLVAETDVVVDGRSVGRVLTEQRMPLFDRLLADVRASSATSDVAICGRQNDKAICAPNRLRPSGFETPMFDAAGNPGLPVTRALRGERGVLFIKDPRGINVVSAFTPIKDFGLGLAVKTDVDTLYAPLRSRLNVLALALVGIVALAIYAQHSQVRPVLKQLVASEQSLARMGRVAGVGGWEIDLVTGKHTWTEETRHIHEVGPDYAPTMETAIAFYAPEIRSGIEAAVLKGIERGEPWNLEVPLMTATGRQIWVRTQGEAEFQDGKPVRLVAAIQDITAAKAAEQALRDSEHRLRMVTDNLPVLISCLDRDLRFRFVNRTYQQWFGSEAAPQIGDSVQDFYGEPAWAEIEPRLRAALAGQALAYDRDMVRHGDRRHVHVTVVPDRNGQDDVVGLYTLISDVSSYREAQRALQESEARLRTMADALPMRVAYIDADERYRFNNLAYERGFGKPREDIQGQTVRALLGEAAYTSVEPHIRSALSGKPVTFQSEMSSGDSYVCYEAHYIPQRAVDGSTVLGFHAVISDITRQKLEEKRLIELARADPLTGLVNRAGFELRLAAAMQRCRATGALMALMYLDIDRFKRINDQFGHNVGDALLLAFARRLSQTLRSTDTVARLGGDEFTVIMEGLPTPEVAAIVANKIVKAMSTPFKMNQQTIDVTTSIGLAFYQGDATSVDALVKQADVMLYQAKGAGRNNVQVALRLIEGGRA